MRNLLTTVPIAVLTACPGMGRVDTVKAPLSPTLGSAVERVARDIERAHRLQLVGERRAFLGLGASAQKRGVDPLRTAEAIDLLTDALGELSIRTGSLRAAGRAALALSVVSRRGRFELRITDMGDGPFSGRERRYPFVEKDWASVSRDGAPRASTGGHVFRGSSVFGPEAARDDARQRVVEWLRSELTQGERFPDDFVRASLSRWQLDEFVSQAREGSEWQYSALFGLGRGEFREIRDEVDRQRAERATETLLRGGFIVLALALCVLSYLHLDWKTRGYLSGPLKILFAAAFLLVAGLGLSLG